MAMGVSSARVGASCRALEFGTSSTSLPLSDNPNTCTLRKTTPRFGVRPCLRRWRTPKRASGFFEILLFPTCAKLQTPDILVWCCPGNCADRNVRATFPGAAPPRQTRAEDTPVPTGDTTRAEDTPVPTGDTTRAEDTPVPTGDTTRANDTKHESRIAQHQARSTKHQARQPLRPALFSAVRVASAVSYINLQEIQRLNRHHDRRWVTANGGGDQ